MDVDDCEPLDENAYPGAPLVCDGVDNDCDTVVADGLADTDGDDDPDCNDPDDDTDGDPDVTDCDDTDPDFCATCTELCDTVDHDCVGSLVDQFADTDGDLDPDCTDPDDDGDGSSDVLDCDDFDDTVFPGATESCDSTDSDCDGSVVDEDDDFDGDLTQVGERASARPVRVHEKPSCPAYTHPSSSICQKSSSEMISMSPPAASTASAFLCFALLLPSTNDE